MGLPVVARVSAHHIAYALAHFNASAATGLRLLGAVSVQWAQAIAAADSQVSRPASRCLPCTSTGYFSWYISAWCFFAAPRIFNQPRMPWPGQEYIGPVLAPRRFPVPAGHLKDSIHDTMSNRRGRRLQEMPGVFGLPAQERDRRPEETG